jgi:hypothetical protein
VSPGLGGDTPRDERLDLGVRQVAGRHSRELSRRAALR